MEVVEAADNALAKGEPVGPLHGVPVTIKDHEAVAGMQIEYGTHLRRGDVADADNAMVSRLRRRRNHPRQDRNPGIRLERRQRKPPDRHHT